MLLDKIAAEFLKPQIAAIARPCPGRLEGGASRRIGSLEPLIDRLIVPRLDTRRLAMMKGKDKLGIGAGSECCICQGCIGIFAAGRNSKTGSADRRATGRWAA